MVGCWLITINQDESPWNIREKNVFPEQKDKTSRFLTGTSLNDGIVNNMRQHFVSEMMDLSHYCA